MTHIWQECGKSEVILTDCGSLRADLNSAKSNRSTNASQVWIPTQGPRRLPVPFRLSMTELNDIAQAPAGSGNANGSTPVRSMKATISPSVCSTSSNITFFGRVGSVSKVAFVPDQFS